MRDLAMSDRPHTVAACQPPRTRSWAAFDRKVRYRGYKLLARLDEYQSPILVSGCQRSGTTMLTRLIVGSEQIRNPWRMPDEELETANVLCGAQVLEPEGRFCFQTTYLNDRLSEYFEHHHYYLMWVLRNPFSVVHSMLTHWKRSALNRLFRATGHLEMNEAQRRRYERFGVHGLRAIEKACLSYNAKVKQTHVLRGRIPPSRLLLIDYDALVSDRDALLPGIFRFAGLTYASDLGSIVHGKSRDRAAAQRPGEAGMVRELCMPVFEEAVSHIRLDASQ